MGIVGKIVEKAVERAVVGKVVEVSSEPVNKALDKASEKLEDSAEKRERALFDHPDGTFVLVVGQYVNTWKETFAIYDSYRHAKYRAKGKLLGSKRHTHVYNEAGVEIGSVKENMFAPRNPLKLFGESDPIDLSLYVGGKKICTMKSQRSFLKRKFKVGYKDWFIEGNITGLKYKIMSGETEIASISTPLGYLSDCYIIRFNNLEDELQLLLIALALDAVTSPERSEELKRTLHDKHHATYHAFFGH